MFIASALLRRSSFSHGRPAEIPEAQCTRAYPEFCDYAKLYPPVRARQITPDY